MGKFMRLSGGVASARAVPLRQDGLDFDQSRVFIGCALNGRPRKTSRQNDRIGKTMLLERSEIIVKDGMADAFLAAMQQKGCAILLGVGGCLSARVGGGLENPEKILVLVEWESMEAHEAFRELPEYNIFRALIAPFAVGGAMEHFTMV
jgi:quinol monooxygenase YgiN